ncbi:hypothetical protein [Bradyrhizobium sp. BR 1433]|uniref:hypothetical protein n=1 Tax=Bradyrhizobium sp. BR 1433 TaxID=3447967 RepID=UPI003EE5B233
MGVRADIARDLDGLVHSALIPKSDRAVTVQDVLMGMPRLRSGLSSGKDHEDLWKAEAAQIMRRMAKIPTGLAAKQSDAFRKRAVRFASAISKTSSIKRRSGGEYSGVGNRCPPDLKRWLVDAKLKRFPNSETRGHMLADLERYFFASLYGRVAGVSPKAKDFPRELAPDHRNWETGKFADRFRVQLWRQPSTTITSHISKDGHYLSILTRSSAEA